VRAVLPLHPARVNQPKICFIDQRGSLQRAGGSLPALAAHMAFGEPAQFFMDQGD
jgi:hypothetical protein